MAVAAAKPPSKLKRAGELATIFTRYGLDFLSESESPWRFLAWPKRLFKRPKGQSQAERVRLALEELGPTYIKLGQAISTRPDIIPEDYTKELAKLQDKVPPVPYEEICLVIENELGQKPDMVFAEFNHRPLAAASLAQVHEAVLPNGAQVVVKVQRPTVEGTIEEDLSILKQIAHYLAHSTEQGRVQGVDNWFDEFEFTLRNELDYTREARNAELFRQNFEADESVCVPRVFPDYSTKRVLTLEKIDGFKINSLPELEQLNIDRKRLARTCALIVLKMVYEHGFFHADPHPGNFFVLPDGRIAIIDTGMVGRLDDEMRDALMRLTLGVAQRDADRLADELMNFAVAHKRIQRSDLKRDIERLLQIHIDGSPRDMSIAQMLNDTMSTAGKHGLQLPSAITVLARCFTMCEGIGSLLDPDFNFTRFAEPYMRELYVKRYSRQGLMERAEHEYSEIAEFALSFPKSARRMLGQLERGELTLISKLENAEDILKTIDKASNRLAMSMLTAGLIAGLSVLTIALKPSTMHGLGQAILIGMLVLIIGAGLALLISIWRTSK